MTQLNKNIWNTIRVNKELANLNKSGNADMSCFWQGNINYKAANLNFEFTKEELKEYIKCKNDVTYFAEKHGYAMTDEGIQAIKPRPYQYKMLNTFQRERLVIMLASRQIGKTVTSSIFLAWYLIFHFDKNVLIVANKQQTTSEIVSKVKTVIENIPFYMRPGIESNGITGMSFDNGCRLISQATTKTAAIGFTIHLLYADEFAHIHENFLTSFYRSIFPTLSSSKISKMIISSTPNGLNLFHDIWMNAINGINSFKTIRVDWWEVPGRDDKWRRTETANLGSEELFQQEYGNKFLSSESTLLNASSLALLERIKQDFVFKEIYETPHELKVYEHLKWRKDFNPNNVSEFGRFVISIDLADGVGRDYTVFNIFQLGYMSVSQIKKLNIFDDESSFLQLKQIGIFRSNKLPIDEVAKVLEMLIFDVFTPDIVTGILEVNFKGDYLIDKLEKHEEYYPEIFMHTQHTESAKMLKLGLKVKSNNKSIYAREFGSNIHNKRIIIYESNSVEEAQSYGIDQKGRFGGRGRNDDIVDTCVNLSPYFNSSDYYEYVEDIFDYFPDDIKNEVYKKLENIDDNNDIIENMGWLNEF